MLDQTKNTFDATIRDLINRETDLVNNRMNWMILLQTFLFAGYSQIYDKDILISFIFPALGIIISCIMRYSFWMNEKAIAFILKTWNAFIASNGFAYSDFPPVWAGSPISWEMSKKEKRIMKCFGFLVEHKAFPFLFLFAWVTIFLINLLVGMGIISK